MSGGSTASGGYNFQAYAIAYVSTCIVTGKDLKWVNQQFGQPDVPIAVSAETGGPGDDIRVELGFASFEAQVKRGLNADARLDETIERFGKVLAANRDARGVIIVDPTSSKTVKEDLASDLQRLRDGLDNNLKDVTNRVLGRLASIGAQDPKEVASRISVVTLHLEETGAHSELAQWCLRWRLETPAMDGGAWRALVNDGHQLTQRSGRRDKIALEKLLGGLGLVLTEREIATAIRTTVSLAPDPSVAGAASVSDRDQVLLVEAVELIKLERASDALTLLDRIESRFDDRTSDAFRHKVANNRGVAFLHLHENLKAQEAFRAALTLSPDSTMALGNLAQAELMIGNYGEADLLALRLLEKEPDSPTGWSVRIQAALRLRTTLDLPAKVATDPTLFATRGFVAFHQRRFEESVKLLKAAIDSGSGNIDARLLLAEATFMSAKSAEKRDEVLAEALAHADEGLKASRDAKNDFEIERALLVRGSVLDAMGDGTAAWRSYQDALTIPGHSLKVEFLAARNRLFAGDSETAKSLLQRIPPGDQNPETLNLLARILADLGESAEVERVLSQIDEKILNEPEHALEAAESAIEAGRIELALKLLQKVTDPADRHKRAWLEARLALKRDEPNWRELYDLAIDLAPEEERSNPRLELAGLLARRRDFNAAIQLFESVDVLSKDIRAKRGYAHALYEVEEFSKLASFLNTLSEHEPLPVWAKQLLSEIAFLRQDYEGAESTLREIAAASPNDVRTIARLATALIELGRKGDAQPLLDRLAGDVSLPPDVAVGVAHLFLRLDQPKPALKLAFFALQRAPGDPEIQMAYVNIFLARSEKDDSDLRPTVVAANTWVMLRSGKREATYHIVEGNADATRQELSASDPFALQLLGRSAGEKVTQRAGSLSEKEFEIIEIKSEFVFAFQDVMSNFPTRFPDNTSLQAFELDQDPLGGDLDLTPIIRSTEERAKRIKLTLEHYRNTVLPFGTVAKLTGTTLRDTFRHFSRSPEEIPVIVEAGGADSQTASQIVADSNGPVVLTLTSLTTLQELGWLDRFKSWCPEVVVPHSLIDELEQEIAELSRAVERGGAHFIGKGPGDRPLAMTEVAPEVLDSQRQATQQLLDWVRSNTQVLARPVSSLTSRAEKVREAIGASSHDALVLATEPGRRLIADDLALRRLGKSEYGVRSFPTIAFVQSALARGLCTKDECFSVVRQLVLWNQVFIPVNADILFNVLNAAGFVPDGTVIKLFDRLRGGNCDLEPALNIGAQVLRLTALSTAPSGSLETTAMLTFEVISSGRDLTQTMGRFFARLKRYFALMPSHLDLIENQLKLFVTTKTLGRRG